jgi:hypothetical protein
MMYVPGSSSVMLGFVAAIELNEQSANAKSTISMPRILAFLLLMHQTPMSSAEMDFIIVQ